VATADIASIVPTVASKTFGTTGDIQHAKIQKMHLQNLCTLVRIQASSPSLRRQLKHYNVGVHVLRLKLLSQLADINETWYEHSTTRDHQTLFITLL
jgi:hypothetical protein